MKITYEWLKDFADLPGKLGNFASKMTLSGSKVEAVENPLEIVKNTVVAQIKKIEAHPQADRLQVCQVDIGEAELLQIVTAATNMKEGDKVPLALDGATLYENLKIKKGKLRGILSEGMFCGLKELGLSKDLFTSSDENGLLILPEDFVLGENVLSELRVSEPSIEFEITSNRPDCFSYEGLGREAAITLDIPFKECRPYVRAYANEITLEKSFSLDVKEASFCPLYFTARITDVLVSESPFWLKKRLLKSGLRPINNIVDITNYVMLELNHPMHAFDYNFLNNHHLEVRKAKEGELIVTLDDVERKLTTSDYVIADDEKPVALAGIMGGKDSGITEATKDIVFEVAYFDHQLVRQASLRHNLRSDSSARFERKVDSYSCLRALLRACQLIEQLGCGRVCPQALVSLKGNNTFFNLQEAEKHSILNQEIKEKTLDLPILKISSAKINSFLGTKISAEWMEKLFLKLGFNIIAKEEVELGGEQAILWQLLPPSFRPDIEGFADVAEEVARFYDYNNIEASLLKSAETTLGKRNLNQELKRRIKYDLASQGYYETYSNPLTSPTLLKELAELSESERVRRGYAPLASSLLSQAVKLKNAAYDSSVLRSSILPDLCRSLRNNAKRQQKEMNIFEWGFIYLENEAKEKTRDLSSVASTCLPIEKSMLALASYDLGLGRDKLGQLFFKLKHQALMLFETLGLKDVQFSLPIEDASKSFEELLFLNPYRSAVISCTQQKQQIFVGSIGYILPSVAEKFELPVQTAVLLLDMDVLISLVNLSKKQTPLPKFPASVRDLGLLMDKDVACDKVIAQFKKACGNLLEEATLFDIYEGNTLLPNQKSLAFHLVFRSAEGTLTDEEVQALVDKSLHYLEKNLDVKLRLN